MPLPHDCYLRLSEHWQKALKDLPAEAMPIIWLCHRSGYAYDEYQPFVGFQAARESLLRQHHHKDKWIHPILILGFHSANLARNKADFYWPGSGLLLDWPGAAYLRYDVSLEALQEVSLRLIEGAKQPLPASLLQDVGALLRLSSDVRHWLQNRLTNIGQTLADFNNVAQGEAKLSPFHMLPVPAVSEQHQKMIDRLLAYEDMAAALAPSLGGLATLRNEITHFRTAWLEYESTKVAYRADIDAGLANSEKVHAVIEQLEILVIAVQAAVAATFALDTALEAKRA